MLKVPAADFQKNFGRYQDLAQREPVAVTSYRRERVVLLSMTQYRDLKGSRERDAQTIAEYMVCRELAAGLQALG